MKPVNTPDGPVNFPDTMSDSDIEAVLQKQYPAQNPGQTPQTPTALKDWIGAQAIQPGNTPPQAPPTVLGRIDDAFSNAPSAAWKMATNVVPDVVLGPSEFLANVANTGADLMEKYGLATPVQPYTNQFGQRITGRIPSPTAGVKSALGVEQYTPGSFGQEAENYAATTAQLAEGSPRAWNQVLPAIVRTAARGGVADLVGQGASYLGGATAASIDPRLEQAGRMLGPVAAYSAPWEQAGAAGAGVLGLRRPDAGQTYDTAATIARRLGLPDVPLSAGALGSRPIHMLESGLSFIPGASSIIGGAQHRTTQAIQDQIRQAGQMVAPGQTLATAAGGPGEMLRGSAMQDLNQRWTNAKQGMDQVENILSNQTIPTGELRLVPLQGIVQQLNGLRTRTVAGRQYDIEGQAQNNAIDNLITNLTNRGTPENQTLHNQLGTRIEQNQRQLANPNTPSVLHAPLQQQIGLDQAARAANMGITFEALRKEKSNLQDTLESSTISPLDYRANRSMVGALGDHLQGHANAIGQGPQYQAARNAYTQAMDTRDMLNQSSIKPVGTPVSPNVYENQPGSATITDRIRALFRNPETNPALMSQPYFRPVAGSAVARLGLNENNEFTPQTLINQWGGATPQGRSAMTLRNPRALAAATDATNLARAVASQRGRFGDRAETGLTVGGALGGLLAEAVRGGWQSIVPAFAGGSALAYGLQSQPALRMLANRPLPWQTQVSGSVPTLSAILAQQARQQNQQPPP